jgi:hypothetical protein
MKKSITLAALLLALGTSVFAAPAKSTNDGAKDEIAFTQLKKDNGFGVQINKEEAGKAMVLIYDDSHNLIYKDLLKGASIEKGYLITSLETGDYTVEIYSKGQSVTQKMHVYDEGDSKSYFFYQK